MLFFGNIDYLLAILKRWMANLMFGLIMLFCSLDSEFLASTSSDGSARIWSATDGTPVTTLERNSVRSVYP